MTATAFSTMASASNESFPMGTCTQAPRSARNSARPAFVDMAHAFAADLGMADFDAAAFADDAFVLDAFVFAAAAFPVAVRSEDLFAEQAAFFGLEAAVVDRLGVLDLAVAPGADDFRRRDFDHDRLELAERLVGFAGIPLRVRWSDGHARFCAGRSSAFSGFSS